MTTFQADPVPGQPPPPDSVRPRESTSDSPTSVARLNDTIRGFIETWGSVWVEGEITSWNVRTGFNTDNPEMRIATYEVKVEGEDVLVRIEP